MIYQIINLHVDLLTDKIGSHDDWLALVDHLIPSWYILINTQGGIIGEECSMVTDASIIGIPKVKVTIS